MMINQKSSFIKIIFSTLHSTYSNKHVFNYCFTMHYNKLHILNLQLHL